MLPFDLGHVKNNLNAGHLQCISGLVHTSKSNDGAGIDQALPITGQATSGQLELSVHLLWLMQGMLEKNTPNVLL